MTVLSVARYCSLRASKISRTQANIFKNLQIITRSSVTLEAAIIKKAPTTEVPAVANKWIGRWLFGCSGMVFGAVIIGGLTRLTESGLSMTDWALFGKLPPITQQEWLKEFNQYQQYPEYKLKNQGMSLEEFKFIWWMEYGHRQWGRLIGTAFLIPAAVFWSKGWFTKVMKRRVLGCGVLLGCQGLLGWYMVKSGLEDRFQSQSDVPRVSQNRLAAHLGTAFVLYSALLWSALDVTKPAEAVKQINTSMLKFRKLAHFTKGWVFLTALSGALVAGLDAGLVYNSFPKFADRWIPSDLLAFSPMSANFTENPTTVQFDHRIMGTTAVCLATVLGLWSRRLVLPKRAHKAALTLAGVAWMQVGLGISTLLLYVPVSLAAMHQSGSLITLSTAIWLAHELKHVKRIAK